MKVCEEVGGKGNGVSNEKLHSHTAVRCSIFSGPYTCMGDCVRSDMYMHSP